MWNWNSAFFSALGGIGVLGMYIYIKFPWLKHDWGWLKSTGYLLLQFKKLAVSKHFLVDMMEEHAKANPSKTMLIFQDNNYSYQFMNTQMNKVAHWAQGMGLKKGDAVTILMHNSPAFIWTYLGLTKIGVEAAFLNYNLRSKALLHCFDVISEAKILLMGAEADLVEAVQGVLPDLESRGVTVCVQGHGQEQLPSGFKSIDSEIREASDASIPRSIRADITIKSTLSYIYTSGTTGLPKAAVVSHGKALKGALFLDSFKSTSDDIVYTTLPLYHSAGNLIGLGSVIRKGCTMLLRDKFHASQFWDDCRKHNVTVIQYVGELARYLTSRPKRDDDRNHCVRVALGNGLRQDVWREFQERFGVQQIVEFYAATEGNGGFINTFNKTGAMGRISPIIQKIYPLHFIEYCYDSAEPVRGDDGFCKKVTTPGKPALAVAKIQKNLEYEGYKGNKDLTEKKVVKNVFKEGDMYFNTGDLIYFDEEYFVYFNDRLGDTFRWKGENVSTTEVSNVVADLPWIHDANVYGVEIPGQEGRTGMVTIMPQQNLASLSESQLSEVYMKCEDLLPSYARPRFIRLTEQIEMTGTFKNRKVEAVKEGFDSSKCGKDCLYVVDFAKKTYIPMTAEIYSGIVNGSMRL